MDELLRRLAFISRRIYRIEQKLGLPPLTEADMAPPIAAAAQTPLPPMPAIPARQPAATAPAPKPAGPKVDLETRIGTHWLNRVGIVATLVGVVLFLKYAFENSWIGPGGQVAIILLAGLGVIVWSETFRKKGYKYFSYSLKAIGVGALYAGLWAAFQYYHLIPGQAAFVGMLAVTASAVVLAVRQDAEILAWYATIGGFATPLLLSTGENREIALFSYVTLLDLAILALVYFRPWNRLLIGGFIGTLTLYIGWYAEYYSRSQFSPTFTFATIFFLCFVSTPLIHAARERRAGTAETLSIVVLIVALANAPTFFIQAFAMLDDMGDRTVAAWIAVAVAVIYILLSRQMHAASERARPGLMKLVHIAIAVGFLTVAIPIKLNTHWITIGWFIEAAVLLWIADRAKSVFLRVLSIVALVLGIGRLLFFDNFQPQHLLFNARFGCYLAALAILAAIIYAGGKRLPSAAAGSVENLHVAIAFAIVGLNLLAIWSLTLEVNDFFARSMSSLPPLLESQTDWVRMRSIEVARDFSFSALWLIYGAVLMAIGFWRRSAFLRWQALALLAFTIGKVFTYDVRELEKGYRILAFVALGAVLMAISFAYQRDWLKLSKKHAAPPAQPSPAANSAGTS